MPRLEQVDLINPSLQFLVSPNAHVIPETREVIRINPLPDLIRDFDTNWQREGLDKDWYTLGKRVGFSLKTQMNLLSSLDEKAVGVWVDRTEQDVIGFDLEYLRPETVTYPFFYKGNTENSQLINIRYNKDITETASRAERKGSVVEKLEDIKQFFLNPKTPDGSLAVMVSPLGPTGLTTDNDEDIIYPDSYMFVFEKNGVNVEGFTIQTDFSKKECRDVIHRLTGRELGETAPEEAYVRSTALLTPLFNRASIKMKEDILSILQDVRPTPFAYKDVTWKKVSADVARLDQLLVLDTAGDEVVSDWKQFILEKQYLQMEEATSEENIHRIIQKALAATILRLSKLSLKRMVEARFSPVSQHVIVFHDTRPVAVYERNPFPEQLTFGDAQRYAETLPGCAGGGSRKNGLGITSIIQSIVERLGISMPGDESGDGDCQEIECKVCGWKPSKSEADAMTEGKGHKKCPICGWSP